jgi:ABC-type antimicrobial peptide transport system permease subunit
LADLEEFFGYYPV